MVNNQSEIDKIASTHLGKVGGEGYSDQYDKSLLVAIPRYHNRIEYGIVSDNLPFVGYDVWNCYEVSALTFKGYPVTGTLKISYSSSSELHVESKSLKLYLNSFNMTKLARNIRATQRTIEMTVSDDLSEILNTNVWVTFFPINTHKAWESPFGHEFRSLDNLPEYDVIDFNLYKSDAATLSEGRGKQWTNYERLAVMSSNLRSNCRVTGQPDWGKIYISMVGGFEPAEHAIAKYIISHRSVNHFHEEICEMTFQHIKEAFEPSQLMVACLYTRRGGIDINPIRSTSDTLIPRSFIDTDILHYKELMQ